MGIAWSTIKIPTIMLKRYKEEAHRQSDEWGVVSASSLIRDVLRAYLEGRKNTHVAPKLSKAAINPMTTSKGQLEDLARGNMGLRKLAKAAQSAGHGSDEDAAYEEAADAWREKFTHFCGENGLEEETEGMDLVIEMENKLAKRQAVL